jgi:hypothetical protein
VLTTGVKGDVRIPVDCTIVGWTLLSTDAAPTVGSIVIDVWKDNYGSFPATVADSITGGNPPTLTAGIKATDTALTGWTTSITAGDVLRFNVSSVSSLTRVHFSLTLTT